MGDPGTLPPDKISTFMMAIAIPWAGLALVGVIALYLAWKHRRDPDTESRWLHALDRFDDSIVLLDLDDTIVRANRVFYEMIGERSETVAGRKITDIFHPSGETTPCPVCQARAERRDAVFIVEADDPHNERGFPMEISITVIRDRRGEATGLLQGIRDLSASREAEAQLRRSETLFRGILESAPDAMVMVDASGKMVYVNSMAEKLFGYSREELIGSPVELLVPTHLRTEHVVRRTKFTKQPTMRPMGRGKELVARHRGGNLIPVEISLSPMKTESGIMTTAVVRDRRERVIEERELERLASFPELSPIPVIEITPSGEPTYMNPVAVSLFANLRQRKFDHPILRGLEQHLSDMERGGQSIVRDVEVDNAVYEQKINYIPESKLVRIYAWDITKMRDMTREMAHQATHDALTGLVNRSEFERRVEQEIQSAIYENREHVLCYMDLDQFKVVNDTCGHIAGDSLLKQLAARMRMTLRSSDTLARLGGDEFGLLLVGCPVDRAAVIAEHVRETIAGLRFQWDDRVFAVGVSIGLVPITAETGTVTDVLSAADAACYIAKESGRNRVHVYRHDDSVTSRHTEEMSWTYRLRQALDRDEFTLHVQEIRPLDSALDSHYEVLIRLIDGDDGLIPPMSFIPAAERYNLMTQIDRWVVRRTLETLSRSVHADLICTINLSGQSLSDTSVPEFILGELERTGVDPGRIIFEITETAVVANLNLAHHLMITLRETGCRFALDDFGSGLSSFSYLRALPVDYLKIDGNLVRGVATDTVSEAMVRSISELGRVLGLRTIAEFVENAEILVALEQIGVDYVQGFAVSVDIPFSDFIESGIAKGQHAC